MFVYPKEYNVLVRVYDDRIEFLDPNTKQIHFEDGPAITYNDEDFAYYRQGSLHREDGPAMIRHRIEFYYLNNKQYYSKSEFDHEIKNRKKNSLRDKIVEIDGKKYKLTEVD